MESVDRANRIKFEINLIGGVRWKMGSLASSAGPDDLVTENDR